MSLESTCECPECGTSIYKNETKCPGCGAVFGENLINETDEPNVPFANAKTADAEMEEAVIVEEMVEDISGLAAEIKQADEKTLKKKEEAPTIKEPGNAGLNRGGISIAVLGALGVVAVVFLDPLMNTIDSVHPAAIALGPMQLAGILVADIVMIAGILMAFMMGKKRKKDFSCPESG